MSFLAPPHTTVDPSDLDLPPDNGRSWAVAKQASHVGFTSAPCLTPADRLAVGILENPTANSIGSQWVVAYVA